MKIDLERLHKQPKNQSRGEGRTMDAVMQLVGTIEVLRANGNQKLHTVLVFAGNIHMVEDFIRLFAEVAIQRGIIVFSRPSVLVLNIDQFVRTQFFTTNPFTGLCQTDNLMRRISDAMRGRRCTQPIFDEDCGLFHTEMDYISNLLQLSIS